MSNGRTSHQALESSPAESESINRTRLVASPWHTILVVLALSLNAYFGLLRASTLRHETNVHRPAIYGRTMIVEWLLLALVLTGVWLHRSPLSTVLGDRWRSARQALKDVGIAIAAPASAKRPSIAATCNVNSPPSPGTYRSESSFRPRCSASATHTRALVLLS